MEKFVKLIKIIRNNWKKTVVGCVTLSYGVVYARNKYETSQFMNLLCEEARLFGDAALPVPFKPRTITVFLNPAANRRKAKKNFEEYCAPLLYLAGLCVNVITTEHEGQVRSFLETFDEDTDAIVIAGGDGTLSEAITGLLRKSDSMANGKNYVIGVLPLGRTNTVANSLFAPYGCDEPIHLMAKATMAVINEATKPVDVMKIEVLESENDIPGKPVYSMSGVHWGAYRDAHAKRDKYWYWNDLRSYVTYIFNGMKDDKAVTWKCEAELNYTPPCSGCSKCYKTLNDSTPKPASRWWKAFLPLASRSPEEPIIDYSKVKNEVCGQLLHQKVSAVELSITTTNIYPNCHNNKVPHSHIEISIGPETVGYTEFVTEGWKRANGNEPTVHSKLAAKEVKLVPVEDEGKTERWMSIDLEDYEVKPVHLTLLPKRVRMFCAAEYVDTK